MSHHLSDPRRKFSPSDCYHLTLWGSVVPLSKSTLVLEAVALSKLLEPAAPRRYGFGAKPPSGTTIRQIKYSIFHEQQVSLLKSNVHLGVYTTAAAAAVKKTLFLPLSLSLLLSFLPCRPDKSLGAFKSLREAAEALPGNLRAERSNIIQKRWKLFLDAKVSPFYIGRNSFEGKC